MGATTIHPPYTMLRFNMGGRLWVPFTGRTHPSRAMARDVKLDPLTGLHTRASFLPVLDEALQGRKDLSLLVLNLERFRTIHLAYGTESGDRVLGRYAKRLVSAAPQQLGAARISADEFALLVPLQSLDVLVSGIRDALRRPMQLPDGNTLVLSCSIAAANVLEMPGLSQAGDLLRRAEVALRLAREQRGDSLCKGTQSLDSEAFRRFQVESDLRAAIASGQLTLYLQSQVDPCGAVVGAECLVRWLHPQKGVIGPAEFLPIAEESDLIVELGEWVLARACSLQHSMEKRGMGRRLSINVSPRQFMKPDFVETVLATIEQFRATPQMLTLEVTEGLLMKDLGDVASKMHQLRLHGLRFSIDDFGTGYASLAYLNRLPVDEVKVARQFILEAPTNPGDAAVVKAILALADSMGMQVVAEGIETQDHARFLNGLRPCVHQGFLYSRPEPADQWLKHVNASATPGDGEWSQPLLV